MQENTLAKIIDGKAISQEIRSELKEQINSNSKFRSAGLAVILVGNDPASAYYVESKRKACAEVGIESFKTELPAETAKEDLVACIEKYNQDDNVDGILLQLPLPEKLSPFTQEIIDKISPTKDVDGLTSVNLGKILCADKDAIEPCTPKGCMELLSRSGVELSGKKVLVMGRSSLVGKPIAMLLNKANATVTMAHSRTADIEKEIAAADVLIAAIGKKEFVKGEWIKDGAVVIDVGINAAEIDGKKKLFGDVEFASASERASMITPVPGGVGPMTVAMLLKNTYELYLKHTA